jgi:hypothetical protein
MEEALQLPVLAPGRGRLAGGGIEADQLVVRFLSQRIGRHGPARVFQGPLEVARSFQVVDQTVQRLDEPLAQALLLGKDPWLVVAGQERPAIEGGRCVQAPRLLVDTLSGRGCLERRLELTNIGGHGGGVQPHDRTGGEDHRAGGSTGRLELAAEGGEGSAHLLGMRCKVRDHLNEANPAMPLRIVS